MIKHKAFFILVAAMFLNFYSNNISFAIEDVGVENRYPDYACEFNGKDTCEKFNRKLFVFNLKLNKYLLRPMNIVWASILPEYGMDRVKSLYANANFPVRLMGCLLQKDFKSSRTETVRFLTNTTLGIGGLYDPAKDRFKIEPRQEDMEQVLAYYKVKKGPYLVLPVVQGNVRDLFGKLLDYPLRPFSYIPIAGGIATAVCSINNTTYMQPLVKKVEANYADPYEIVKQIDGIEKYIKNSNLDREDVFKQKIASQNIIKINNVSGNPDLRGDLEANLKADIEFNNYNSQGPLVDSMRTALFEDKSLNDSIWAEMSVWNRTFSKKIKLSSVNIDPKRPNYKYRYILQKNKTAPVAIIYPSIGEGIMSDHSTILAKIFYDEGYSVVIQGSAFQWEFVKSMPDNYRPGFPSQDSKYLRLVTSKILNNIQSREACRFDKKLLMGTSFGALTTLFVAAQEENENTLGISNYISINPPIEIMFAIKQLDKYSQDWKNDPSDIKMRAAITAEKVVQVVQKISDKKFEKLADKSADKLANNLSEKMVKNKSESKSALNSESESLPFTNDEAKLIIGFVMKQKLSDVVFSIENDSQKGSPKSSTSKKSEFYQAMNKMSFYDYAQKYLLIDNYKSYEQLNYDTSLHSIADFLRKNKNYKIYHTLDDYFVNPEQLAWLKNQTSNKSVFFSNGSHLGFLYRKEFMDQFKKDITLQNPTSTDGVYPVKTEKITAETPVF